MATQIVVLSEVRLFREGLAMALSNGSAEAEVVGVCQNALEVLQRVRTYPRAVVLIDLGSTRSLGEIRQLMREAPAVPLLALALSPDSEQEIVAAAEAGIAGYLPPDASIEDVLAAVERAARGEMLCSPRIVRSLARRLALLASDRTGIPLPPTGAGAVGSLTTRELEVLDLLNAGYSNKQIARQLTIRLATVKNHVHSILAKLNVKRRGEATAALRGDIMSSAGAVEDLPRVRETAGRR